MKNFKDLEKELSGLQNLKDVQDKVEILSVIFTVKELRSIIKECGLEIKGAWKMTKNELLVNIINELPEEEVTTEEVEEVEVKEVEVEEKPEVEEVKTTESKSKTRKGNKKIIEVYKDGELVNTLDSLTETFKWAKENKIANAGLVRNSLKTGQETVAGSKYKEGGYLFKYALK
ncbi:MAG TPA: hypothetical protein K8V90_08390 [Romboutsia timonensis]|uniref:Uncharacterized protein n=1 Tax=Romboutsia timonensis TaxID=1776391 RepID=A0A921N1V7_9FIRM|nr:hypothetical protein [Romboutsia timonensis]